MKRILWTKRALTNLEAIGDFLGSEAGEVVANRLVSEIIVAADRLIDHPHSGRPGRVPGTRELVIPQSPYILPYRVFSGKVQVLAVLHGARKWPTFFG